MDASLILNPESLMHIRITRDANTLALYTHSSTPHTHKHTYPRMLGDVQMNPHTNMHEHTHTHTDMRTRMHHTPSPPTAGT